MCICINCVFYQRCWIKDGINKIPKNFVQYPLKFGSKNQFNNYRFLDKSLFLFIQLNSFSSRQTFEFDVIECETFCEKPGLWLKM